MFCVSVIFNCLQCVLLSPHSMWSLFIYCCTIRAKRECERNENEHSVVRILCVTLFQAIQVVVFLHLLLIRCSSIVNRHQIQLVAILRMMYGSDDETNLRGHFLVFFSARYSNVTADIQDIVFFNCGNSSGMPFCHHFNGHSWFRLFWKWSYLLDQKLCSSLSISITLSLCLHSQAHDGVHTWYLSNESCFIYLFILFYLFNGQ